MTYDTKERLATGAIIALIAAELMFLSAGITHAAVADWQKGATMVPRSTTDLGSESFLQSLTDLKQTGANSVAFVYTVYQDNASASELRAGWNTPTDASLRSAIRQAHDLGLSVNLKLHAESHDGTWRAYIRPSNRDAWYGSYNHHLMHVAGIAQEEHAELITIGTEMVATAAWTEHPDNNARWLQMIANVRGVYSGKLTYGANSNSNENSPFTNEKKYINFWSALDYASISAYYRLESDASVDGMKGAWHWWNNNDLRAFQQSTGKPLLFAEIGYRSIDGAHYAPWDWGRGGSVNQDEQANAYEALMGYWNDYSYMAGVYWWDWSTDPNAGGNNDHYTPQNKKAETVMTRWFTNPTAPGNGGSAASPAFGSSGSSNPGGTTAGNTLSLAAVVNSLSTSPTTRTIIDIEVYNESNQQVFQKYYEAQDFGSQESRTFTAQWAPSAAGTYRMAIGVFSQGWGRAYHWNNAAANIVVTGSNSTPPTNPPPATSTPPSNPPPAAPPASGNLNIWWPTDGARVSGVQPLKAMVEGREVGSYAMYWQVDNGGRVEMYNSDEDYPHKEAWVDYSGWNWNGSGQYLLTFTAAMNGSTIATKSVRVQK